MGGRDGPPMEYLQAVTCILNILSAISSVAVVGVFLVLRKAPISGCLLESRGAHVDTVSIRLQVGIACLDLVTHLMACFAYDFPDNWACEALGFVWALVKHAYLCLSVSVSVNLHLVVICRLKPTRRWEPCYWAVSASLPFLLNLPLLGKRCLVLN